MDGRKIADHLARLMANKKGKEHPKKEGSETQPEGPESIHVESPEEEKAEIHAADMSEFEGMLCPSCHEKMRHHMANKQATPAEPQQA